MSDEAASRLEAETSGEVGASEVAASASRVASAALTRVRRWRRRLLVAFLGILALILLLLLNRASLTGFLLPRIAPGLVSDALGVPVTIGGASVTTGRNGELIVELRRVALGEAALRAGGKVPRAGGKVPRAGGKFPVGRASVEPLPITSATVDRVRVELTGWLDARHGLAAIERIECGELTLVLPENLAPEEPVPTEEGSPGLPDLTLLAPGVLPEVPFPISVAAYSLVRGELALEGAVHTPGRRSGTPPSLEVTVTRCRGFDGLDRGKVLWTPIDPEHARFTVALEPLGVSLAGTVAAGEGGWEVRVPELSGPGAVARVEADLPRTVEGEARFSIHLESYDAPRLAAVAGITDDGIPGLTSFEFEARGVAGEWQGSGELISTVGPMEITVDMEGEAESRTLIVSGSASELSLGPILAPWLPEASPEAIADLEAWVEWDGSVPVVGGSVDIVDAVIDLGAAQPVRFRRWASLGSCRLGEPLDVEASVLDLGDGMIVVEGTVPLTSNQAWQSDFTAREIRLESIAPIIDLTGLRGIRGGVDLVGRLSGAATNPEIEAEGWLRGAELAPAGWERIRSIDADLSFDGHVVSAERLSARIGGGTVQGEGSLTFEQGVVDSFDSELRFDGVRLLRSRSLRARGSGRLGLLGTPEKPRIEGELEITRGIYDQDIHPSLRGGGGTSLPFDLFRFEEGFMSRVDFDVSLDLAGNFEVRNNRVRVAPFGKLSLLGTGYQPFLIGAITASSGQLILPRIAFDIAQVEVRFPEDDPFSPRVQFVGRGMSRGIEIEATAAGDLFSPEVQFSSSPSYPEEDLLLLVATGRLREQIASNDVGIIAATELARLYGPQVWGSLFGTSGSDGGILDRIEVGAKTSDDTGELDGVTLELKLNDWISVLAEQDGDGESTADLRFFWWFP